MPLHFRRLLLVSAFLLLFLPKRGSFRPLFLLRRPRWHLEAFHLFTYIVLGALFGVVGIVLPVVELILQGHIFDDEMVHVFAQILILRVKLFDDSVVAATF